MEMRQGLKVAGYDPDLVDDVVAGEISITRDEIRGLLCRDGFVHITGLPYRDLALKDDDGLPLEGTIQPSRSELGRWDRNNGKMVVVTIWGEVWLSTSDEFDVPALEDICPNGREAFVPMSNTDVIDPHCLLHRVYRQNWSGPGDEFSPVPKFRD